MSECFTVTDDQPSNKDKRLAYIRTIQAQEFGTEHSVSVSVYTTKVSSTGGGGA